MPAPARCTYVQAEVSCCNKNLLLMFLFCWEHLL